MTIGQFVVVIIILIQSFISLGIISVQRDIRALEKSFELHNVILETTWKDVPILGVGDERE